MKKPYLIDFTSVMVELKKSYNLMVVLILKEFQVLADRATLL
jgi:hypothetical protein